MKNDLTSVGCAGWALRSEHKGLFEGSGSHLERYASRFNCVEINSSFYKEHRSKTYERWAASVPETFKFSAKLPKAITHEQRLESCELVPAFLDQVSGLGHKLGPILVQLPPSLKFEHKVVLKFFSQFRKIFKGPIVYEPRNITWFTRSAEEALENLELVRVVADPPTENSKEETRTIPSAYKYFRLHGSPKIYYSEYSEAFLKNLAIEATGKAWCIFDNTAQGFATTNALAFQDLVNR